MMNRFSINCIEFRGILEYYHHAILFQKDWFFSSIDTNKEPLSIFRGSFREFFIVRIIKKKKHKFISIFIVAQHQELNFKHFTRITTVCLHVLYNLTVRYLIQHLPNDFIITGHILAKPRYLPMAFGLYRD